MYKRQAVHQVGDSAPGEGVGSLLPSYFVDVWVSGSDAAGNPFVTQGNSLLEPVATWKLALLGPSFDIFSESSMVKWDKPTPVAGEEVTLTVSVENEGGRGNVSFVLQRFEDGGYWADIDRVCLLYTSPSPRD